MPGFLDDFLGSFTNNQATQDAKNVDYKNGLNSYLGFGNNGISNAGYDPAFTGQYNGNGNAPGTDDPQAFQNWLSQQLGNVNNLTFNGTIPQVSADGGVLNFNTENQTNPNQSWSGLSGLPNYASTTPNTGLGYNIASHIGGLLNSGLLGTGLSLATGNGFPTTNGGFMGQLAGGPTVTTTGPGVQGGVFNFSGTPNAFGDIGGGLLTGNFGQGNLTNGTDPSLLNISNGLYGAGNAASGIVSGNLSGAYGSTPQTQAGYPGSSLGLTPGVLSMPGMTVTDDRVKDIPTNYDLSNPNSSGGQGGFDPGGMNTLPAYKVIEPGYKVPTQTPPSVVTPQIPTPVQIDPPSITPPGITYPQTPGTTNPGTINAPGIDTPSAPGGGGGTTGTGSTGDRNAYPEGLAQNYAEAALAPQQFGQYAAYSPAYAAQDAKNLGVSLFGQGGPSTIAGQYAALTHGQQDPLLQQQNTIASGLLANGGNLSASELRNVQQSSRAGFAARGLDATNASVVDEAMQTDAQRRARLLQNMGIAQNVVGQNQAQTGLINSNNASLFGLANNMTTASNAYARNQFDPFNAYGQDLANTNYNAGQARTIANQNQSTALQIANMNAAAAKQGGILSGIGSLIGGSNGIFCWAARAVFGEDNPKWLLFREWMLTKAPNEVFSYYLMHGEELAERVKASPELRAELLPLMENCILELKAA
jgi:hypothetical protein